ncbi:hypothetical protein PV08_04538 [Exophiala spinifera]|uniref:C2H2-type domain-containing protein n=1 Tax=Exophiala spinifera TaxID=91928 RepID=A0A0D1YQ34_9EURO|nr:uncharacterized protein PV08_04538 [Exophiala spinifera]KIW17346.1 hypothetical protein PV08_04538 [Exophiala spinifera]
MAKRSRDSSLVPSDDGDSSQDDVESARPLKLIPHDMSPASAVMQCSLPPHREAVEFSSIEDFESHYAKDHSNRCASCGKNFPTAHFLTLHIDENHNPFREALQAKGEKTYACFVEDCDKKCSTPQKRRLHLVDRHLFPKAYNFRIVDNGIDKSTSMLREGRRRRVSTATEPAQTGPHQRQQSRAEQLSTNKLGSFVVAPEKGGRELTGRTRDGKASPHLKSRDNVSDASMNDLEASMSSLQFVPHSVASRQRNKDK